MVPLISINNCTFTFGNVPVLSSVSLTIKKGETWSIIGKNGVGKSTLIKCLAGLYRVPRNVILINDKDIRDYHPGELARLISYVPQASGRVLPPFTVKEYVMMGRYPYQGFMALPCKEDISITQEALDLTDTIHLADRRMETLSGGEVQRVFLAGAVAQRTSIVVLDEPATFLDPLHQELVRKALSRIHDEFGTTLITVTHDINAAISRYTHLCALHNGTVFFAGLTSDFTARCPDILSTIFSIQFTSFYSPDGISMVAPGALV